MLIRPFLPESPSWAAKKRAGTLRRPSFAALFTPEFRRTTIVTTIMMACVYAAAFGAIQQMPRIVPGLADVQEMERTAQEQTISGVQTFQEFGGLAGRLLLAVLAAIIVARRRLLWVFQIPGLILLPLVYFLVPTVGLTLAQWGIFIVGLLTIGQMSFWGNYLPRVYPTHLRGTGESFAANVGGRMIGTFSALVTVQLVPHHARRNRPDQTRVRGGHRRHHGICDWLRGELLVARTPESRSSGLSLFFSCCGGWLQPARKGAERHAGLRPPALRHGGRRRGTLIDPGRDRLAGPRRHGTERPAIARGRCREH